MIKISKPSFDLFTLFEMTPDLVCIAGTDGFLKKINPAVSETLGYTEEELLAAPVSNFIYPHDRDLTSQLRAKLLTGKALLNFENRYVTKAGKIIWLAWTSIYSSDDEIVFAIAKNITVRKQIELEIEEKYIKFKSLATHFKTSIEEDRKFVATELHEELAQLASVIKMDIDWISNNTTGLADPSKSRIDHALVVSDLLINTIRRISFSISPHMLDDLGLNATLIKHCREFSVLTGIPSSFEAAYQEIDLTKEVKIDFFRICQESLANVMTHSQANEAKIYIKEIGDQIILTIADNGIGFNYHEQKQTPGLIRMRERAASINGHLTIKTAPGKGTSISVAVSKTHK